MLDKKSANETQKTPRGVKSASPTENSKPFIVLAFGEHTF
jgi:hypothetical protein